MAKITELDNMRIWNSLGKTDPAHTKQFTRAGGFRGTAVKPMWANKQMTEFFGPCGLGWGPDKPEYQIVEAGDEVLVFCTVGIWYTDGSQRAQVYGVGGDKVVIKGKEGTRTSDEAFKAAYTDALSNAMKFIGVAADVHMGLFDDSKYVQSMREEFKGQEEQAVIAEVERQKAAYTPTATATTLVDTLIPPELDWSYQKTTGVLICRVVGVTPKATAKKREYLVIKINQPIDGQTSATYFHEVHRDALSGAVGKVCKFMVSMSKDGKFVNVDEILEIDGMKVEKTESDETKARLLASTLELTEKDLAELHAICHGSWAETLMQLGRQKAMQEGISTEDEVTA